MVAGTTQKGEPMNPRVEFAGYTCDLYFSRYHNGQTALTLLDVEDRSPVAKATLCVPELTLDDDEVVIKNYSENKGMYGALLNAGIVEPFDYLLSMGFGNAPVCRLTPVAQAFNARMNPT